MPRPHYTRRQRALTRTVDAAVSLGVGLVVGLIAHRLAGDEPLTTDPEYLGHLFAEAMIVLLTALIAWWLIDDIRGARRRARAERREQPPE